jgi:hypothetical protein
VNLDFVWVFFLILTQLIDFYNFVNILYVLVYFMNIIIHQFGIAGRTPLLPLYIHEKYKIVLEVVPFLCRRSGPPREYLGPRVEGSLAPSSNSANNDAQTKSTTVCHKQGISRTKMN